MNEDSFDMLPHPDVFTWLL